MRNIFLFILLIHSLASIQAKKHKIKVKQGSLKESLPVNFTALGEMNDNEMEINDENNDKVTNFDKNSAMYDPRNQQRAIKMEGGSLECIMCSSNGSHKSDADCYKGISTASQSCAESDAACYIQLHPAFIRRGCLVPRHVNITFVCKCPLCNDKTSKDLSYYKYTSLNDWEYDNERLSEKVSGSDLLCKVCETKGTNPTEDQTCLLGRNSDYMHCGHKQMCYTNINPQMGFGDAVSRGCIDMPVANSYYKFCNKTKCNNEEFPSSRGKRQQFVFRAKTQVKLVKATAHAENVNFVDKFVWILSFIIQFGK